MLKKKSFFFFFFFFNIKGKNIEAYNLSDITREVGIGRKEMQCLAMLLGSDYTEGINGVSNDKCVLIAEIALIIADTRQLYCSISRIFVVRFDRSDLSMQWKLLKHFLLKKGGLCKA